MLWTDLISPAEATGYIRTALAALEINNKSLARWLPNTFVSDLSVRFVKGQNGLVAQASYRAFDAAPEIAGGLSGQRVTLELPAMGQKRIISEYDQLKMRNASEDVLRNSALKELDNVARAIADLIEKQRGTVLETGKATSLQENFKFEDDFGRSGTHTVTAPALWSLPASDRLTQINGWLEVYRASNDGADPGVMLMSNKAATALASGEQFRTVLVGGASRPARLGEMQEILLGANIPGIEIYDRRTSAGRVISENKVIFLPAPVDPNGGDSALGATYWGQTLTSMESEYGLADVDQPGVVAGVHKSVTIPHIASIESDAIASPVLGNANLSFVATVL